MPVAPPPVPDVPDALAGSVRALLAVAERCVVAPAAFLAAVVEALIGQRSLPIDRSVVRLLALASAEEQAAIGPAVAVAVAGLPATVVAEDLIGQLHEALLALDHRHANGVYYTPVDVAAQVVALVEDVWDAVDVDTDAGTSRLGTVCDPAMGGGAFLLAAGRALERRGWGRGAIVERSLWGLDIDPVAVAVAEAALVLWAAGAGDTVRTTHLLEGDSLLRGRELLEQHGAPDGFDAVVGNPPFQSQLGLSTARDAGMIAALQERFGKHVVYRYTDTAALFLLEACRALRPGGRAALVLPQSVLVSGDARAVRDAVLDLGHVTHVWVAREAVFSANVRVCAVGVLRAEHGRAVDAPTQVARSRGRTFAAAGDRLVDRGELRAASTWGALVGDLFGAPLIDLGSSVDGEVVASLGSFCHATAGFRDQYYGLVPHVREATPEELADALDRLARRHDDEAPAAASGARDGNRTGVALLMTCGLIDPARCRWGTQSTKFAREQWQAPVVDLDQLGRADPVLADWAAARLVPKLVVSTQTRILEAAIDTRGDWYPSVPTIALSAPPDRLWHAAAVVMAPAVTAWLFGRHAGAALSNDAIKVSARQLLEVPLPRHVDAWDAAVAPLRAASSATDAGTWRPAMAAFGACMHEAYGGDDEVLRWWLDRVPPWR